MNRLIFLSLQLGLMLASSSVLAQAQDISPGDKSLPLAGESFKLNGHDAFIIAPADAEPDTPWVWYAPTLPGLPAEAEVWMFRQFLDAGIAVAGIDVGESYGSPAGRKSYASLHDYLVTKRQFSERPVLLARSRGGLMLYSWAVEHPDSVAGIAGIYPVCNIESYPGLKLASPAFELTPEQLKSNLQQHNPVDRLRPLADARVPIFHIHGDQDKVVPVEANSGMVAERYQEFGGEMKLELVLGQGHNMWPGWFQSQRLVDFVISHAKQDTTGRADRTNELWLTYPGAEGPGKGKHVVLIAAEQEYRCEQSMPMLAKILSQRHGFDCTVLFSVNDKGEVDPTLPAPFKDEEKSKRHRIPGLEKLADADCVIWLSRFMQLPDDQMQHFHDYFDSGKPLIALRTANHGFLGGKRYQVDGKTVALRDMLGGAFKGHHGGWHRESTKGIIAEEQRAHPILTGVKDVWGTSDVYRCHDEKFPFPDDCTLLLKGQPLINLQPDAPPNTEKEALPIAWTKTWTGNDGRSSKIFHFTMGSGKDFQNTGVRRLAVNAVFWGLDMEDAIQSDMNVETVGDYQPLKSGFNYEKLGVAPRLPEFYR